MWLRLSLVLLAACGRLGFDAVLLGDATTDVGPDASCPTLPVVENLDTGELVIDAAQTTNTVSTNLPLDRTILFTSVREIEQSPNYGGVLCELLGLGLRCTRTTAGTDFAASVGEIHVRWTVVTFSSGVSVQRGIVDTRPATPVTVALTAVDPSSSFIILGGITETSGQGWGNNEFVRAQLLDATTLEVGTFSMGSKSAWQVVSMDGARVTRESVTLADVDNGFTSPGTFAPGTFALVSQANDYAHAGGMLVSAEVSPTDVTIYRELAQVAVAASWEVISLPFATMTGHSTISATASALLLSLGVDPLMTVALASGQGLLGPSGGATTYNISDPMADDLVGDGMVTLTILPTAQLELRRDSSQGTATIDWAAIDFSQPRCVP